MTTDPSRSRTSTVSPDGADAPGLPTSRFGHARILLVIALPLIGAYLAELAIFTTTKIIVGRLGYLELAAVSIAGDLTFEIIVVLMGLLSVVGVFVAEAEGGGDKQRAGDAVRQGLIVGVVLGLPAMAAIWNLDVVLRLTGQDPQVIALAVPYLQTVSFSVLPIFWFSVFRLFVSAIARTGVILIISFAAVALNYALTLALVHGIGVIPATGLWGAGLATAIVNWAMFIALAFYIYGTPALRGHGLFRGSFRIDIELCVDIFRFGVPVGGLVFIEAGLFAAISILSGILGPKVLATHGVLMGWIGIPFVIALGLAEATMVRVAYANGRSSRAAARDAGLVGMVMGISILAVLTVIPLALPELIVAVFISRDDSAFGEIVSIATLLLMIAAVFQVFDGLQAIAARALRGLRDTIVPLWIAAIGYWALGIGGGSFLAFFLDLGATGLWVGLALGLVTTGTLLSWRFLRFAQA